MSKPLYLLEAGFFTTLGHPARIRVPRRAGQIGLLEDLRTPSPQGG